MQEQPTESVVVQTLFEMAGITKQAALKMIHDGIEEAVREAILLWHIEDIEKTTGFKKTFLEKNLLCDPRIRQYERKRGPRGERVWFRKQTLQTLEEIIWNEWN